MTSGSVISGGAGKGEERVKMFAQISPETVNLIAETLGITSPTQGSSAALDPKVTRALAEDASYRVREVVNLAAQILKHSKRRRLTTTDLNKAFDLYDADPILGHSDGSSPQGYSVIVDSAGRGAGSTSNSSNKSSSSGDQNLMYVPQERLIDLRPFALGPSPPVMASEPGVQATWLAVEGHFYPEGEEHKPVDYPKQSNITQTLLKYYQALTNIILGDSEELFRMIISDVRTNPKIGSLLPWLVSFIRNGMQRHCENKTLMFRLLSLLQAVFSNSSLNLSPKPYLSHLVTALLSSLIVDRSGGPGGAQGGGAQHRLIQTNTITNVDHVQQTSQILRQVLDRWATPVNQLGPQTHNALRIYLKDPNWSHSSHYGVLSAMIALGPRVLDEFLVPQLEAYILRIAEQMQQATNTANTAVLVKRTADLKVAAAKIQVLNLMWGTLVIASRSLLGYHTSTYKRASDTDQAVSKRATALYNLIQNHFGDAVSMIKPRFRSSLRRRRRRKAQAAGGGAISTESDPSMSSDTDESVPGRIKLRSFRGSSAVHNIGSSRSSHLSESKRRKLSASIFDTAPDLNVPMDIFDPEDEEDESGNPGSNRMTTHFDAETPDQTIGQSVRSAFDVTDFQTLSCWRSKRRHRAQLLSGTAVQFPSFDAGAISGPNLRFHDPNSLNRHRPRKSLIRHAYHDPRGQTSGPQLGLIVSRMGDPAQLKRSRTSKREKEVQDSCCIEAVL